MKLMETVKINENIVVGGGRLTLFGGPCMAESLELCLETAKLLTVIFSDLTNGLNLYHLGKFFFYFHITSPQYMFFPENP